MSKICLLRETSNKYSESVLNEKSPENGQNLFFTNKLLNSSEKKCQKDVVSFK